MDQNSLKQKRPLFVFLMQLVLLVLIFLTLASLYNVITKASIVLTSSGSGWRSGYMFVAPVLFSILLGLLFYGLTFARRWAWFGGFVLLTLFTLLSYLAVFVPHYPSQNSASTSNSYLLGSFLAKLFFLLLPLLFLGRWYSNPKIKLFFGVGSNH